MELKKLNRENLIELIKNRIPEFKSYSEELIIESVDNDILSRLDMFLIEKNVYFHAEDNYVETEWKDMISLHYINTSYCCNPTVMRIHLLKVSKKSGNVYLGFFTIRIINELSILLSYIYPNLSAIQKWEYKKNRREKQYICTYQKIVHLEGKEFLISTFPMFIQDGTVASCAHATMLSLGHFLYKKYKFPAISLQDINKEYTYNRTKNFPTPGLGYQQVIEIFSKKKILIISEETINWNKRTNEIKMDKEKFSIIRKRIDTSIESAFPVMILGRFKIVNEESNITIINHAILIIGHTFNEDNEKKYIIYDDSGALLEKICGHKNIIGELTWEEFEEHCAYANFLFPQYEKVYLNSEDIKKQLANKLIKQQNRYAVEDILEEFEKTYPNTRMILMDNVEIKMLLHDCLEKNELIAQFSKTQIQEILSRNLPHYLWYCEIEYEKGMYFVLLADPTFNKDSRADIFINKEAFYMDRQLCILTQRGMPDDKKELLRLDFPN